MNAQQKRAYYSDCLCNNNLKSRITKNIYNEELYAPGSIFALS